MRSRSMKRTLPFCVNGKHINSDSHNSVAMKANRRNTPVTSVAHTVRGFVTTGDLEVNLKNELATFFLQVKELML